MFFASLNLDELHEFVVYKTSPALTILKSATITETKGQDFLRMDVVWDHLSKRKMSQEISNSLSFLELPISSDYSI